jgi:protein ImuB
MALWLCLRFDALPLEALLTPQSLDSDIALVVVHQRRVLIGNEFAQLAGVMPGQSVSTAQTLLTHQNSRFWERSLEAENTLLQQLLNWAYGVSPHLQQWQDNALMIEVGSCLRLHHGLDTLLKRIDNEISLRGLTMAKGVAETRTAAWLLSHADPHLSCEAESPLEERLASLPLNLLTTAFPQVVTRLEKAGITEFGHLLRISLPELG